MSRKPGPEVIEIKLRRTLNLELVARYSEKRESLSNRGERPHWHNPAVVGHARSWTR